MLLSECKLNFLLDRWSDCGLESGDTLLLHSNVRRTLRDARKAGIPDLTIDDVLDGILNILGSEGTLLLPLFNFSFTSGSPFDIEKTPSKMGVLTEVARCREEAVRTGHPVYSFCALGRKAKLFSGVDNYSGYGANSPFAMLRELNGKIGVLDLPDQNSMTFYHHVEEMEQVSYRFHKNFKGLYKGHDKKVCYKEYSIFVRNLDKGVTTFVNPAGELMWREGLYVGSKPGYKGGMRVINSISMFDFVASLIKSNQAEGNLFRYNK